MASVTKVRFFRTLLVVLALIHLPLLGFAAPFLRLVLFLPVLFWINIPGTPLGLVLGESLYEFHEFGVVPQSPLAWALIEISWVIIGVAIAFLWLRLSSLRGKGP